MRNLVIAFLGLGAGLGLLLPVVVLLKGTSQRPHSLATIKISSVQASDLEFVVERIDGIETTPLFSPCPRAIYTTTRQRLYKVTYRLGIKSQLPLISAPVEVKPLEQDSMRAPRDWSVHCERLGASGVFGLCHTALHPKIKRTSLEGRPTLVDVEGAAPLAVEDAQRLRELGFDVNRVEYSADTARGRCYLGFDPFGDLPGVQVSCPRQGTFRELSRKANHRTIWDLDQTRLLIFEDALRSPVIGMPRIVTVWDYDKNTVSSYDLTPISPEELR